MSFSILLVVEKPDTTLPPDKDNWNEWSERAQNIAKLHTNSKILGENTFLISIDNTLSSLNMMLNHLDGKKYKYAIFDTEMQWRGKIKDC